MNRKTTIAGICALALAMTVALAACGGADESSNDGRSVAPGVESEQKTGDSSVGILAEADASGAVISGEGVPGLVPSEANTFDRKIIQDTTLDLLVENVSKSYSDVERIALVAGGFVLNSSVSANEERPRANLTIRVPTSQYQTVVDQLRGLALEVENESSKAQDVTQEYTDYQARLRSLQAVEATYLELLNRAETIDDILKVQNYLNPVRLEIEQIQGQLNVWDNLSSLATISVSLSTEPLAPPDSTHGNPNPLKAAGNGWEASLVFLRGVGAVVFGAVAFLWWVVPIWIVIGIGFVVRYRMVRKSGGAQ